MVHADLPQFADIDVYSQFLFGNETRYNNEPFWTTFRGMNLKAAMETAGFAPDQCFVDLAPMAGNEGGFTNTKVTTTSRAQGAKTAPGFGWGVQVGIK